MRLILDRIRIENFKGCRHIEVDFSESRTRLFGMNGVGKTTIADAFAWCMWNKDSHGNAPGSDAFRDKPLDEDGREIHYLDTTVELTCKLDGQPFNLRRTQRENWVKKRGSADAVYQGNASTYWINDVETKLSDFKARISQIASEDLFRLIASLSAFNAMDWKKRREQLLSLSGSDVDGELLARAEYRPLADECAQRNISIDGLRKYLVDQRKRTNEELRMIPVRIDEARKALPSFTPREIADAEYLVADSLKDIERIDGYIAEAKAQNGAGNARMKVLALEQELVSLKRRVADEHLSGKRILQAEADAASAAFRSASASLADAKKKLEKDYAALADATAARDKLREKFTAVRDTPVAEAETVCPCCGQSLPQEAIEAARSKMADAKRAELAAIKLEGKAASETVERCEASVQEAMQAVDELTGKANAAMSERDAAFAKVNSYPAEPDYAASEPRIADVEQELTQERQELKASPDEKIRGYESRKAELQAIIDRNRAVLARRDAGFETEKRIAALEAQQKDSGARVSEIESLIALCEKFVQDRCSALEASINARFPSVRWKLFDIQINGGIVDVCTCMIPCDSGLVAYESANTAAQVHADCEIIDVLSRHYDVSLPLFIDNAERCNSLPEMDSQTIELYVSTDESLSVREA